MGKWNKEKKQKKIEFVTLLLIKKEGSKKVLCQDIMEAQDIVDSTSGLRGFRVWA